MQPATTAQQTAITVPITSALRNFYQNIAGTPNSQQAESDVTTFNKQTPRSADVLSAFDEAYGVNAASQRVGELRKGVMQAEDLVNNVDDNVFARTSNALVSDSQRARLTAAEKDPLTKQLGVISRNFDVANQDLGGLKEQSNRYSGAELGDIETMRSTLGTRLTTTQQREAAEREAAAEAERQRQWWANYELQKQQNEAQLANLRASTAKLYADIANSNRTYDLQRQQASNAKSASERAAALQREAQIQATRQTANAANAKVGTNQQDFYNSLNPWEKLSTAAVKNGPMALLGKGLFW